MKEEYVIGVDLGGTKILTALSDLQGNVLSKIKVPTEANKSKDIIIQNIKDTIYEVVAQSKISLAQVKGIGLGSPGPLDIKQGLIHHTPNLNLDNVNIIEELKELKPPVFLENDANAAALGEKWFGAGQDADDLIYITVSTGIGGGIIVNKEIYHGVSDGAGEIGHATIDPHSSVQCGCGNYGCLEALASGTAIGRQGKKAVLAGQDTIIGDLVSDLEEIDGAIVAQAAAKNDQLAQDILTEVANYLGIGLANLINIFNPKKIIIGGGVSESWELLQPQVEKTITNRAMSFLAEEVEIVTAQLEGEVGVKGAIATALSRLNLL